MISLSFLFFKKIFIKFGLNIEKTTKKTFIFEVFQMLCPLKSNLYFERVGSKGDGGYLVPKEIGKIDAIFSPGVALNSDFELYFANKGIDCFMVDASVTKPALSHPNFHFEAIWLSHCDIPGEAVTLKTWLNKTRFSKSKNLILQMDIEGGEYDCITSSDNETLDAFKVIIVELHHLNYIFNQSKAKVIKITIQKILENHSVVHAHVNNNAKSFKINGVKFPEVLEVTFVRKDLIDKTYGYQLEKHELDQPNVVAKDWNLDWRRIFALSNVDF